VLIRNWSTAGSAGAASDRPGALLNNGGDMTLLHVTAYRCVGMTFNNNSWFPGGASLENRSGTLRLVNTLIWRDGGIGLSTAGTISTTKSLIEDNTDGATIVNPQLTKGGYLTSGSSACIGKGVLPAAGTIVPLAITGWPRKTVGISNDIGADQWLNNDADNLPDWWEKYWFGSFALGDSDNPDADELENGSVFTNLLEFKSHTCPLTPSSGGSDNWGATWDYSAMNVDGGGSGAKPSTDTDGDGIADATENKLFLGKHRNGLLDADEDGLTDKEEIANATYCAPLLWDSYLLTGLPVATTGGKDGLRDILPYTAHGTGKVRITTDQRGALSLFR
jgi:hypothetical protein